MDTQNENKDEFQHYELPIRLFHHDLVLSKVLNPSNQDYFQARGLTFSIESDRETVKDEIIDFDIQSVDIIHNPEYDRLLESYKIPIFFKSNLHEENRESYIRQGFVDNGRHKVWLEEKPALGQDQ